MRKVFAVILLAASSAVLAVSADDPWIWLEDVQGEKALAWASAENAISRPLLEGQPGFNALHERLVAINNSRERIPTLAKRGQWYYNFWQDSANPRGVWRRTTLEEFRSKEPAWEIVLDLGKLAQAEGEKWVFKGALCLFPDYRRCLISLSRAGADAVTVREFDTVAKDFVKDGFEMPESKGNFAWRDADTLYIARDFGRGTMTASGYPRQLREWKRGTPMNEAKLVLEADENDVGVSVAVVHEASRRDELISRSIDIWNRETQIRRGEKWVALDVPSDAELEVARGQLFVHTKKAWTVGGTTYASGSLLAIDMERFLAGGRDFGRVFDPSPRVSLKSYGVTKGYVLLNILDNVKGRLEEVRREGSVWTGRALPVPPAAAISVSAVDANEGDAYWLTVTSFLEPTTLYLGQGGKDAQERLRSLPSFFDARGLTVLQYEATSKDGTRVPYFVVMREDAKLDGANPTILYGYGGYQRSMTPSYNGIAGSAWLEKGGVWVLANIRGGGEFGPEWHRVAQKAGRHRAHEDFLAVAEDLIARKISSPRHLAIMGGSQGGLLVGAAFTQRPELFRAVVCQVPLLDMKRFHKLLAGASWIGEYGDPDKPEEWAFISQYSPYQKVVKGVKYPKVFFYTSTRDDRVHPGHARKMVARMKEQGHNVLYYENMEGGHAAGTTPTQQAYTWALTYSFLLSELR